LRIAEIISNQHIVHIGLILFLGFGVFFQATGQGRENFSNHECGKTNLTLQVMDSTNSLYHYLIGDDREGMLQIHPFKLSDVGEWSMFQESLSESSLITYQFMDINKSRFFDGYFVRYQQLYQGIPVVNGGFTILVEPEPGAIPGPACPECPPIGPCGYVVGFSPRIYEDFDPGISTTPVIGLVDIHNHLSSSVDSTTLEGELHIVNNIKGDCAYLLVWMLYYTVDTIGDMVAWMDAQTGELILEASRHAHKNAPTADWGTQWMNDTEQGGNTVLKNDRLSAYDFTGNPANYRDFKTSHIPKSPTQQTEWQPSDGDPELFQLFWMSDKTISEYSNALDIDFSNIKVAWNPVYDGAVSLGGGTPDGANFIFGRRLSISKSLVEYDVIAHEFGHAILRQFFYGNLPENGSLHEGLSDIFGTYIESLLHPAGLNWVIGKHVPTIIRDLENTTNNCYNDIAGLGINYVHTRGEALGHWFYLCVTGDAATGILPMDIHKVVQLILEALPNLGDNPDYPDLMAVTIDIAEQVFGTCSDEFLTILRAWEQICVPTGHRMADPNEPCVYLVFNGDLVCEESNTFLVSLSSYSGLNNGRWTIVGRNSTYFQSAWGMQGNQQHGGTGLHIISIPNMPYYPQEMSVYFWHSDIGYTLSQRITILDCLGDDLTCEEYYGISVLSANGATNEAYYKHGISTLAPVEASQENELRMIAFDLMGRQLDIRPEHLSGSHRGEPRIIVLTYWDQNGNFVKSQKVLIY
jgi:Zn-dependent metalloprotease